MTNKELEKANLHKVVEVTLDEYVDDCNRTPYRGTSNRPDKSGYIGQILSKVELQRGGNTEGG